MVLTSMRAPREPGSDLRFALTTLGRLWVAGVPVDWRKLSQAEERRRVVLPTYPFERKRYWLEPRAEGAAVSAPAPLARREDPAQWFYLPSWKRTVAPPRDAAAGPPGWLVFTDAGGLGDALAARLTQEGGRVLRVRPGTGFLRHEDGTFEVAPDQAETYAALVAALTGDGGRPSRIIHLWGVDASGPDAASVEHAQRLGLRTAAGDTPIQLLAFGDEARPDAIAAQLDEAGYRVTAMRPPAVPEGHARLRITLSALHTEEQVAGLAEAIARVRDRLPLAAAG